MHRHPPPVLHRADPWIMRPGIFLEPHGRQSHASLPSLNTVNPPSYRLASRWKARDTSRGPCSFSAGTRPSSSTYCSGGPCLRSGPPQHRLLPEALLPVCRRPCQGPLRRACPDVRPCRFPSLLPGVPALSGRGRLRRPLSPGPHGPRLPAGTARSDPPGSSDSFGSIPISVFWGDGLLPRRTPPGASSDPDLPSPARPPRSSSVPRPVMPSRIPPQRRHGAQFVDLSHAPVSIRLEATTVIFSATMSCSCPSSWMPHLPLRTRCRSPSGPACS